MPYMRRYLLDRLLSNLWDNGEAMADNTDRANPVIAKWQKWRNADHEDAAVLTRGEIITLLEEPRRLSARVAELESALQDMINRFSRCAKSAGNGDDVVLAATEKARAILAAKPKD